MPAAPAVSDEALIPGLIAREEAAVAELLDRYWARAYRVALQLTGDPAAAEDAAQETFVRLLDKADQFQAGRAFRPWFFQILVNTAKQQVRGAARRKTHEERVPPCAPATPVDPVADAEAHALVREHLAGLSPKLRAALSLRYLEELSLGEVALALGVPPGTVSSRIRRGLESLRESLQPALPSLSGVAGTAWLRRALEATPTPPAAPGPAEVLARLLDRPLLPPLDAPLPPEPGALIAKAGAAAAALAAGQAATAAKAGGVSRGPLLAMAMLLTAGAASSTWLLTGSLAPTPRPTAGSLALTPPTRERPAVVGDPDLALALPTRLTVGDTVEAPVLASWPGGDLATLSPRVEVQPAGILTLEQDAPRPHAAGGLEVPTRLSAQAPGLVSVIVALAAPGRPPLRLERTLEVRPAGRAVTLVSNVLLQGPEAEAQVRLPAQASALRAPRRLELRALPGLLAEAELSLDGFDRTPVGCFEQTTAATFPSALVLDLASQDVDADPALLERARRHAEAGALRLQRFQHADGAFSLHPGRAARLWLTAVGLQQLVALSRVVPVDGTRVQAAARALLAWQQPDGHFEPELPDHGASPSPLALTGYALTALRGEGVPADPQAVARGFAWLRARVESPAARGTYELALAARALLALGDDERAATLAEALAARATLEPGDRASWSPDPNEATFTGTLDALATVELTGIAVQVLARTGHDDLALRGLAWLAAARTADGFGGTQATIQALEAFRVAGALRPAQGRLEASVGGSPVGALELARRDGLQRLALGADLEAALAIERGVGLRFQGAGTLRGQLALHGEVPWEASGWTDGEVELQGAVLGIRVIRPGTARVGVPQPWRVEVSNRSDARVSAPMVEVSLPPGYLLANPAALEALTSGDDPALLHHELLAGRLVLYLPDLAPGETRSLSVSLLPTVAGRFAGGALWAYPYYQRAPGLEVRGAPDTVRVLPAANPREPEPTLTSPAAQPRPRPSASPASPAASARPAPTATPEASAPPPPRPSRIGWDAKLGPLSPAMLELPLGDGPLERLLALALLRGLPSLSQATELVPDQSYELLLGAARWSDGTPVTLDDYLVSWEAARGLFAAQGEGVYRRTEARILHTMRLQVLDARRLRISLPEPAPGLLARLDRWPFLPRHRLGVGRELLTNGLYQLRQPTRGQLELVGPGSRVVIEEVGERPRRGYDLAFVRPSPEDPPAPSAGLYSRRTSSAEYHATLATLFPAHVEELIARGEIARPDLARRYPERSLGYEHARYAGLAQGLATQLREAGRAIDFVERETRRAQVDLWVGRPLPAGESLGSGRYFPLTTGSRFLRGVDRQPSFDATDGAAFVRWPLRWAE